LILVLRRTRADAECSKIEDLERILLHRERRRQEEKFEEEEGGKERREEDEDEDEDEGVEDESCLIPHVLIALTTPVTWRGENPESMTSGVLRRAGSSGRTPSLSAS
jgi:hypothetical protein